MTTKLIEKFTDKSFSFRKEPEHRVSKDDLEYGIAMVDQFFTFVNTGEVDITMDGIIEKADQMVTRFGINAVIVNPWNCIEHKKANGQSETEYVSECLQKFIAFLKRRGIHGFLVAHPTKIRKDEVTKKYKVATLYDISGSAHFFNKTHNGMSIYRDFETGIVDVHVQKVKDSWLGKIGYCTFTFDPMTRVYKSLN
jgi:twinkle protein